MPETALALHADRLLPVDPAVRAVARDLYRAVRDLPIIAPHGHVDARLLVEDRAFDDPTSLLLQPDHYLTRVLHANGVPLAELGVGEGPLPEDRARRAWRRLCEHWAAFAGTPMRDWLSSQLVGLFDVAERPSARSADRIYDQIAARLTEPDFRPRRLLERFGISVLATTNDPVDDLADHRAIADEPSISARVLPTFRPDRYLEIGAAGWSAAVDDLGQAVGAEIDSYAGFIAALEERRRFFIAHGATSTDHGHLDATAHPLQPSQAEHIFGSARLGQASAADALAWRRHMMVEMARMSCDDGLVMTVHPGVRRNHHPGTFSEFGPNTGHDIPVRMEYTESLRPILDRFGTHPSFHLVLFTVDATLFTREIGPLASFYPSVFVGMPWWFLDNPTQIQEFQRSVSEIAGLSRLSGFVDDTRAFCSIPARHDMARRLDAGFLAGLVAEHRLDLDEAYEALVRLVDAQPRHVFKL